MAKPKRIPVKAAKDVGKAYNFRQVLLVGMQDDGVHVITWGKSLEDCRSAAESGNNLKRIMGWPEHKCHAKPARDK